MDKIKCSVGILTLNSEKYLRRTLESVRDFVDVFILDGNSTDSTITIAKEFGARVFKQFENTAASQKITDFAAMKNKMLEIAENNWFLNLDSDEFLSPEAVKDAAAVIIANETAKVYSFREKQIIDSKIILHSFGDKNQYIRLFNRQSGVRWNTRKKVHEKLFLPEGVEKVDLASCFFHYSPDYATCIKKDEHYLKIAREKILANTGKHEPGVILASIVKNIGRAFKILAASCFVYVKYNFADSLPPNHVYRYVRYHLAIAYYRLQSLIF